MPNDHMDMVNSEDPSTATPASSSVARPPLRRWTVLAFALLVLASTTAASVLLWHWVDGLTFVDADKKSTAHLDVLKLTASIAVGGGGLFALYLAARRQRTQELELAQREEVQAHAVDVQAHAVRVAENNRVHAEQVAQDNREDAAARRVTELYAKSVEQLGSEKAAVRLGGLYALERLAQGNTDQQSTVGSVLCAYLRMPHPRPHPLPEEATAEQREAHELAQAEYTQERETRQTALDILTRHHPEHKTSELRWPTMHIRLQRADLTGVNLVGANLTNADLAGANLTNADLAGANLTNADLVGANLTDADLAGANLTRANLIKANLTDTKLTFADLTDANLTRANLTRAHLAGAHLIGANLAGANLTGAHLASANLTDANLINSNLTGAHLAGVHLTRANLTYANLTDANLINSNLTGAHLAGVHLTRADLTYANLTDANLTDADLTDANLTDANHTDDTVVVSVVVSERTRGAWW
jgi:uncharacterized protein YjbI with pentapeptide repeats